MRILQDTVGRRLSYLRLSVTDVCNYRCTYCLPGGWQRTADAPPPLAVDEIRRLVSALASIGIRKVRLTGGEPTLRKDLLEIVRAVASVPGIQRIGVTTNGHDLARTAGALRAAGVTTLNLSIDSLDPTRFAEVTGRPILDRVRRGLDAALAARFESLKVNAVLLRGTTEAELEAFLELTREKRITVRFIELMNCGDAELFARHHVSAASMEAELVTRGWALQPRRPMDGPARAYAHPQHVGGVGIIAPYSKDFCASCNRLRVTSRGALRLCLFGEREDSSLRHLLASDTQRDELAEIVARIATGKPASHRLKEARYGRWRSLASIGG